MLLYYITDRHAFAGDEACRRRALLEKIAEAAANQVDYIQLREKDLSTRELESLARQAIDALPRNTRTRLLINSRTDVALAVGAHGVHLRSDDVSPDDVRLTFRWAMGEAVEPVIGVSCHSAEDVSHAAEQGASFAVFAPVFEKKDNPGAATGLEKLREACRADIPVLALGGVNLENAKSCIEAGAAGLAGIRLFQENNIPEIVRALRS